ncbi:MAG TPA: MarR family transcriptional regulator [Polyangiales bacterium]|jgi:DNA-binding MarR family transcriptional regulator
MKGSLSRAEKTRKQLVQAIVLQARQGSTRSVLLHSMIAERLGLNPSDHKCADLLALEPEPSTPGRMAELTGLSTGAITGVLDRLERAGFVVREPDPNDRRRTLVRLTPEHMPNMKRIFAPLADGMERLCAKYTLEELSLILHFMRQAGDMAAQAADEVRRQIDAEGPIR